MKPGAHSAGTGDDRKPKRRTRCPIDDFEVVMTVEHTQPGTVLDDQLRREQAAALFALLSPPDSDQTGPP